MRPTAGTQTSGVELRCVQQSFGRRRTEAVPWSSRHETLQLAPYRAREGVLERPGTHSSLHMRPTQPKTTKQQRN